MGCLLLILGLFGFSESIIFQSFHLCSRIAEQSVLCSAGAYPFIFYTVLVSESRTDNYFFCTEFYLTISTVS